MHKHPVPVHENYELNIRYHYQSAPVSAERIDSTKSELLKNVFLITETTKLNDASSAQEVKSEEKPIQESNMVPPASIRAVIDMLEKNNEPVNKKSIQKYLHMDKMSTEHRRKCIAYLNQMGD